MTFDLFAEEAPSAPAVESFMMEPTGEPNRWHYRSVLVACDMRLKGFIGHWSTVEPLGDQVAKSDLRVALCKAIDAHLAREGGRHA